MADPDQSISNGTCFSAVRQLAADNFIPCGNWVFGNYQCCQAGDYCLDDNACYNPEHGTTYLAGCTDLEYRDASCPDKKSYKDYPWAGLIYCKPNRWVACEETAKPYTITVGDPCTCPSASETMTVAFSAPSQIAAIGSLPSRSGGTIEWEPGHFPTASLRTSSSSSSLSSTHPSAASTLASATSSSVLPTTTTASASDNPTPSLGHSLSDGAKAGIGAGAAVGGILLFGALSALWVVFRRRRNDKNTPAGPEAGQAAGPNTHDDKSGGTGPAEMPTPVVPPRPAYSELPVGPWVVRPELPGEVSPMTPGYRDGHEYGGQVSPPGSPPAMGSQEANANANQGWVGMPPLTTVEEEREMSHQQGQPGLGPGGPGQWTQTMGNQRPGQGAVLELPA
ncbi:25532c19-ae96-483e-956b-f0ce22bfc609 [Thermothielavioides terrestris]|uniref:Uncharacterized protein n=2 Tax=Thermothielavioides terrestris TaxID=2587410 RepID=G2QZA2_THETT|nr:uncharacterized protein THITE_2088617 [Thermothielavioides terrestris NRRL 8126]AEO67135.1 hypothetical protein THITE_2088617 [Thermothielavioides terrestris NRRL 8126]SPQ23835.1 25532c19-ae96-483e-956b-f0ce22bfc609 [Thermothielavioides terrestris]